ncbi:MULTISPECIES: Rne/Rng family ribonuclease [unclassified Polynucleobacter]|uniref:Rne/Rng family ribonuclease n=1 Tax=unclassified Polynucleobacter TaxID=2640945 RepID=UPI001BFDDC00|nr:MULTISPECIES: Rne/Rng family ribonuclease [unclassified Polynucleobacter]MEA9604543.1 Rne/Rng family ribonuclease [Polynucleobacter sp. JS-JIR-II-c23]QWE02938.1 Rne/Rng family ribonuclease [Polynucleobacter sp. JS-JIR-II-b4]
MKRMLFNATQQEELRVAIVDGQKLIDIDIEAAGREQRKGNIYKGVITRIEPSLEACFVNYGEERHGFLPFKEVARTYFKEGVDVRNASIKDALREGQEIIVQVEKEERGQKGAALTSFVSLAGRYLVLMPNNPRGGGVSRRIEGEDRQELREAMSQLQVPDGMSIIARTAGIGRDATELQWDLSYLMQLWTAIDEAAKGNSAPLLIYLESSLVIRAIRDYFQPDIGEILIDTDDIYEQAAAFMSVVMPDNLPRVKRYQDDVPLFSRFQIEHQIETAYSRTVPLPSGGAIVIDHTEALVSVDVNSARATRGSDIEETATRTNLEAADEIARQARLRDLGGLIVIDFIDMESSKAQKDVENRLRDALRHDRARVQMGKISKFGLMEMSRQRLRPALSEGSHVTCPRCNGTGHIRDTESSALQVLRIIQEEAMKENTAAIHTQVPVEVAAFLLNEKRAEVIKIETRFKVNVLMVPNKHLETPHYKLERLRHDDPRLDDQKASYVMAEEAARELETDTTVSKKDADVKVRPEAAVKGITPTQPAPVSQPRPARTEKVATESSGGFFGFIKKLFASAPAVEEKPAPSNPRGRNQGRNGNDRNRGRNRRGERTERPAVAAAEGAPAEGANNNRNRNNRNGNRNQGNQNGPKPERQDGNRNQANPAAVTPATEAAPGSETTPGTDGEERRGRGRNRRGRGRGQRGERTEGGNDVTNTPATAVSASPFAGPPVGMAGASASMPIQNIANSFGNAKPAVEKQERPERAPRAPRQSNRPAQNSAPASAPAPVAVAAAPLEVIAKPAPELPKVAFQALEETSLHSVVQSAGMIWVATDSSKHADAQSQIQAEPVAHNLGRAPKPAASLPDGPMVLVETGGQEKTV